MICIAPRSNIAAEQYGSYYCEVKTNSGMGCEVSQPARIEPASVNLERNLEKKSGEQLRQLEGGHFYLQYPAICQALSTRKERRNERQASWSKTAWERIEDGSVFI